MLVTIQSIVTKEANWFELRTKDELLYLLVCSFSYKS
jgi:hypothetical protein